MCNTSADELVAERSNSSSAPRFLVRRFKPIDECVDRSKGLDIKAHEVAIEAQPVRHSVERCGISGKQMRARNPSVLRESAYCLLHGNPAPRHGQPWPPLKATVFQY